MRPIVLLTLVLLLATPATHAAPSPEAAADALVAEGAALGEQGRWAEAVAKFQAAEARFPRAIHHCNIGLAWSLAERWVAARLALIRCRQRAISELPAWVDVRTKEVDERLQTGDFVPVALVATPEDAVVRVDGLPKEVFRVPSTVWVGFGQHRFVISAPGHRTEERTLVLKTRTPVRLAVELSLEPPVPPPIAPEPAPEPEVTAAPPPTEVVTLEASSDTDGGPSIAGVVTVSTGAVALVAGVALHAAASSTRSRANGLTLSEGFTDTKSSFETERAAAAACYGIAAVGLGLGLYLLLAGDDEPTEGPTVSLGAQGVSVGWRGHF